MLQSWKLESSKRKSSEKVEPSKKSLPEKVEFRKKITRIPRLTAEKPEVTFVQKVWYAGRTVTREETQWE